MVFKELAKLGSNIGKSNPEEKRKKELCGGLDEVLMRIIKERRSIRKYKDKAVPFSAIEKILEAARNAPSVGNTQPWEFIVITDKGIRHDLAEACFSQYWMIDAPVLIVAGVNTRLSTSVYGERGEKLYGIQNVSCALENMLLMVHAVGLGACWVGAFSEPKVSSIVHFPDYVRPCAIITLGYPDEEPPHQERQSLADFVHYEIFGQTGTFKKSVPH